MSGATSTVYPPISWAQRNDLLYVSIDVECQDIDYKVTDYSFHFKGVNALDSSVKYDVILNFCHPVDPKRVKSKNIGRCLEFIIYKKETGPYWPSLTVGKTKLHFVKANFAKWKNESDDEDGDGMPKMPQFGDAMDKFNMKNGYNFDDFDVDDDDENDSDDNIPTLSPNDENDDDEEKKDAEPEK